MTTDAVMHSLIAPIFLYVHLLFSPIKLLRLLAFHNPKIIEKCLSFQFPDFSMSKLAGYKQIWYKCSLDPSLAGVPFQTLWI